MRVCILPLGRRQGMVVGSGIFDTYGEAQNTPDETMSSGSKAQLFDYLLAPRPLPESDKGS